MNETHKYYGKYRGTVFNGVDPEQRGGFKGVIGGSGINSTAPVISL